jgi:peptide/nickel transport system permease protein
MRHLIRRAIVLLLTLWTAVTLNFFIPRLMPGDPAQGMLAKFHGKGPMSPEALRSIEIMLGISHQSLLQQYFQYWSNILHFNFGVSYTFFPYTVAHEIGQALPWTLVLVGVTTVVSFVIGTLLGIWSAWRQGKVIADSFVTSILTFTSAFPYFWFALLCAFLFSFLWNIFPLNGGYSGDMVPNLSWGFLSSAAYHSILPAFTIFVSSIGGWQLGMRNNMISALSEDYVTLAKARGLSEARIAISYAARNAILPSITGFAMSLGFIVGGSVLTEMVFGYPGMGNLLYVAVSNEDYPLMQGIFLIIVVCVVLANFAADIVNVFVDPRIRRGGE